MSVQQPHTPSRKVLLIDDDASLRRVTEYSLHSAGFQVLSAGDGKQGLASFQADHPQVVITDIEASNGVIHVIDSVLLPETRTIVDIAVEDGRFTTLVAALDAAGLVEALQAEGPFTVFAPTDEAFAALPDGTVEGLLADTDALTKVLLYHVVDGKVMAAQVIDLDGQEVQTLSGDNVLVMIDGETVKINEAQVIIPDVEASNGVIHVIDAVLVP